jgi:hypothetical protein
MEKCNQMLPKCASDRRRHDDCKSALVSRTAISREKGENREKGMLVALKGLTREIRGFSYCFGQRRQHKGILLLGCEPIS